MVSGNIFLIWGAEILYGLHQKALEGFTFSVENNKRNPDDHYFPVRKE